jgi:hypothetical protein
LVITSERWIMLSLLYLEISFISLLNFLFLLFLTFTPAIVLIGFVYGATKLITEMKLAKNFLAAGETPPQLSK